MCRISVVYNGPVGAGAGRTADHLTVLFNQKVLAVQKAMTYTALL